METGMNLYGGALQVYYLLQGLADRENVRNILVCPQGSAIAEKGGEYAAALYAIPMKGDLDLFFVQRLLRVIKKENPDIVHLHSRRGADILGGIAARLTGTSCVLTRRVDNPENRVWTRFKYRLYDRVITISDGIRQVLISEGVPPEKITCVRSAVDTDLYGKPCDSKWFRQEFGLAEDAFACGVVAQLIPRKGHRYLLEAVPDITNADPNVRFLIFGKGPLEASLGDLCRTLGIEDKVIYAGFRDDLDRILGCLDLLIHPALMEGLGVSLLQAAAAGVPVVGTRVGGIPEIVKDGVNGYLVPPCSVPSLVEAVNLIVVDRDLGSKFGAAGRMIVEDQFSINRMVEGNLAVYRAVMNK